jgi:hypothetical protein
MKYVMKMKPDIEKHAHSGGYHQSAMQRLAGYGTECGHTWASSAMATVALMREQVYRIDDGALELAWE